MRQAIVSIIVPIFNAVSYLERCVDSLRKQTYQNIEIILVDDGSTDTSFILCKNLKQQDERIHIFHQENSGVVCARNTGIENATGDYLMFVDADDWIETNMVEELVKHIGNADIISSGVFWEKYPNMESCNIDDYEEGIYDTAVKKQRFFSKMIFDLDNHKLHPLTPWIWNKLYKTELVKKVYQTLDTTITFAEDTTFVYKCFFLANSFVIMHMPFYHYCYNDKSVCHNEQRNILSDINKVYISLYQECNLHNREECLVEQLQNWITLMTRVAINERMRFNIETHMPEFLLDTRWLKNDSQRIVVYGAGQVGQDFSHQLKKLGYDVSLWVDGNYLYWKKQGLDIHNPEEICFADYDEILIAVSSEKVANSIFNYLLEFGIEADKIKWEKPIVL